MPPKKTSAAEVADRLRVGATLKAIRQIRGWSVDEFSKQLDVSYSYLSNIEAGRKPLTDRLLARSAALLEVPQIAITHPRESDEVPA